MMEMKAPIIFVVALDNGNFKFYHKPELFSFFLYSKGMASVVTTGLIGIEVWSPTVEDVQVAKI